MAGVLRVGSRYCWRGIATVKHAPNVTVRLRADDSPNLDAAVLLLYAYG